jgi:hypothetical protein
MHYIHYTFLDCISILLPLDNVHTHLPLSCSIINLSLTCIPSGGSLLRCNTNVETVTVLQSVSAIFPFPITRLGPLPLSHNEIEGLLVAEILPRQLINVVWCKQENT